MWYWFFATSRARVAMDLKDELLVRTFLVAHFRRWSELIGELTTRRCRMHTHMHSSARYGLASGPLLCRFAFVDRSARGAAQRGVNYAVQFKNVAMTRWGGQWLAS